ncbi:MULTISPECIES: BsuPI-related putative proteinase inhibitor [unclassified Bacillus (in: firmicutes)]|uniref:BsuPI-related putative proteinase inhibitor n=1 Tax=unclassified Bacillus (in: firmicutes) TaxID=185979 RepID=UPI0008F442E6|nr:MULTISPECIES: BsuPI-related putative proteinase inhibitor [unclassified Bacillus (in: firmicutes)]SFA79069.1 Intracellular proteinase inhibitor [Bacillus sp. UNCCL13]SFQ69032.1 Intracellular proteinase inhibitor [Bacillus sp. cl95]
MKKFLFIIVLLFVQVTTVHGNQQDMNFSVATETGTQEALIRLKVENQTSEKLKLEFPTSQFYEYIVKNQKGKEIFRYSNGRSFLQAIQQIELDPGEEKIWEDRWTYPVGTKPGDYVIEAVLKASILNDRPSQKEIRAETSVKIGLKEEAFRGIVVSGSGGKYTVQGEISPSLTEFFYLVEDGHHQWISERKVDLGKPSGKWRKFKLNITVPSNVLPENGTLILFLYEKKLHSGEAVNHLPVKLESFPK